MICNYIILLIFKCFNNSFEGSNGYFFVKSNGDVVLKSQLDYENRKQHELQVTMKGVFFINYFEKYIKRQLTYINIYFNK